MSTEVKNKRGRRFSDYEKNFIRTNAGKMSDLEIGRHLGREERSVYGYRKAHKIGTKPRNPLTEIELAFLTDNYADMTIHELMANMPGRTAENIYRVANRLGLKKSDEHNARLKDFFTEKLKKDGKRFRFEKGHTPANKGQKGIVYPGPEKTWFKKGSLPKNTKFDGAISVRNPKDPNKRPEKYIRIAKGKWVQYRRWLWEQHHGPIPKGYVIRSKNGDPINFTIEDLEMISQADHALRNINTEKAAESMKAIQSGKKRPKRKVTRFKAAMKLSGGDSELARELVKKKPRLVSIQQLNMQLKREVRYGTKPKNG